MINTLTNSEKISLYMELTFAIVTIKPGVYEIWTPEENIVFKNFWELMNDIETNLWFMLEIYENCGEMDEWEEACKRAGIAC